MDFVLNGRRHALEPDDVRSSVRGRVPEDVRAHWVDVDGLRWPPKQALALATGLDRTEFTSHIALRQLERLGFQVSDWSRRQSAGPRASRGTTLSESNATPPRQAAGVRVVLVGCAGSKTAGPRPAAELFTGAAFVKGRQHAAQDGAPWYVLSAKFGLLDPAEVISPYDVYLEDQPAAYREAWGGWVVAQLAQRMDLTGAVVEVHAGRTYCEPLEAPLRAAGAVLHEPLSGLRQGERLAWYGTSTRSGRPSTTPADGRAVPPLQSLLDERSALPPHGFLARGRAGADAPGLYTWWVDSDGAAALTAGLEHAVSPGLLYAGRAGGTRPTGKVSTNTLWGRVAGMHLGGRRSFSTFRLSLAACLGPAGVPVDDEAALTAWMHQHLRVAVLPLPADDVFSAEVELLDRVDPPLNLRDVPVTPLRQTLSRLRSAAGAGS